MGKYIESVWETNMPETFGLGYTGKKLVNKFEYYMPTKLNDIQYQPTSEALSTLSLAQMKLLNLNNTVQHFKNTEAVARLLLRVEAVSSSYIEGKQMGSRRILKQELAQEGHVFRFDPKAAEIVGNINAINDAVDVIDCERPLTIDDINQIHMKLLVDSPYPEFGGHLRDVQNWVGGSDYNPLNAAYVPPAPEYVEGLMEDLVEYINTSQDLPLIKIALAHAQFESIHPYKDGNGRCGRALIHLILKKEGLGSNIVPPISLILATFSREYVNCLMGFRYSDESSATDISNALNKWVIFFSRSVEIACDRSQEFDERMQGLEKDWRDRLGRVRAKSALDSALGVLVGMPIFTAEMLSDVCHCSLTASYNAIKKLEEAGIIVQMKGSRGKRAYEVPEMLSELNRFQRLLASPAGDTSISKPVVVVPDRMRRPSKG